jgi:hypothetical protein
VSLANVKIVGYEFGGKGQNVENQNVESLKKNIESLKI